jgi:glycosyltransferase involved in cell wall biosynthesis
MTPSSRSDRRDAAEGPLVSVVTPFYNTAEYLENCIESVLAQTYRNFEYVLLNNCSDDGSREIVQRYAAQDDRIKLHTNAKFLNQTQNYNAALKLISPESRYTKIVQADDAIFPRCLEEMVAVAESDPTVGLVSAFALRGRKVILDGFPFDGDVVSGRELCRHQLLEGVPFVASATSYMYRSEIVRGRDPFFRENTWFDDTETCYTALEHWNFGFVRQVFSFLRDDNVSTMSRIKALDPEWWLLDHLIMLRLFGRRFLNEEEFERRWKAVEREYLEHLAPYYLLVRDPAFWNFHEIGLRSVDYELDPSRMRWLAARYALGLLVRPRDLAYCVSGLFAAVRRRVAHAWRRGTAIPYRCAVAEDET